MTDPVHKLGEVLRAARESKGVDLARVERDTKIRERYLSALERGEYRELPGAVYTKGFLRNYGAYLGLDSEYLIDLYRLEASTSGGEQASAPTPPRPMAMRRRRTFVVAPGAVAAAILTILVGALIAGLGYQFVTFARTPELRVVEPAGDVADHPDATIIVRGVTAANARITVSGLPENPSVTAGADGRFEVTVGLLPGSNVIHLTAFDPVTSRTSEEVTRTVDVRTELTSSPTSGPAPLILAQPPIDSVHVGPVPIVGTGTPGAAFQLSAVLATPPISSFSVTNASGAVVALQPVAPAAPAPTPLTADAAGALSGSLPLPPGTWDITLASSAGESVTRRVTVQPGEGLTGTLRLAGGDSYLEVDQDGAAVAGVSGGIANAGENIELRATREIRILAGNAGAVQVTINGVNIGAMGAAAAVVEWRITVSGS